MKQKLFSHRKILALLLILFSAQLSVAQNFQLILNNNFQTNNGSAPQGHLRWVRTCFLVTSAEMIASGATASQVFNYLRLNQNVPAAFGASGTVNIYIQNTNDATYLKSATWTTLLGGMTQVTSAPFTLPTVAGAYTINYNLAPFTYTGGAMYVAIEYSNPLGTLAATTAHLVNTVLTSHAVRNQSAVNTAPATLALTASRPDLQMGFQYANDVAVSNIYTLGKFPIEYGAPTIIQANIRNAGTATMNSINVSCTITGANSFTDNVPILSLAPGASQVVTFTSYAPTNLSTGDIVTVTASTPGDANATNDVLTWSQDITQNVYSYKNPALPNAGGVGFNGGTGDFVAKFNSNPGITPPYTNPPEINEIKVDLTTVGQTYQLGIWNANGAGGTPGTNLWTSPVLTSSIGTSFVPVPNISVSGDYYVGVRQIGTTNIGFGYQTESPIRSGTFYYASPTGSTTWNDFAPNSPFRFSIEVQVRIPVPPNCAINFSPSDASAVTCSTPVLSWQGGGGAPTGYDVYFSTNQTDVTNMVPAALVSANQAGTTYTPAGLSANATYYWKVIPRNADGVAAGCSTMSFTTGSLPNCYCIPVYTGTLCTGGISNVTFNTISNSAACAPPAHAVYPASGALTTTVGQNGVYNLSVTTTDACIISAWIDYNQDGIIDTTEWSQVTTASVANTPSTVAINIPGTALLGNTLMRVRSRLANNPNFGSDACTTFGSGSSQDYVITIVPPIPCSGTPNPGNTLSSALTVCPGGTINFSLQNPTAGVGVTYQWQNLNGNILGATNTTYSQIITGYDEIKCAVTCSGNTGTSVEAIVDISSFINCYCAAGATTGCTAGDEYVGNVTFNTINNSSVCANTYTDFTSITTSVTQAQIYAASVLIPNFFAGDQATIWIDFDHNGIFNTTDEQFALSGILASATVPFTGNILIPITSLTGLTRMRVRGAYTGTMSPCGDASFGEVEDYFIDIVAAPVCTGTPTPGATTASTNTLCGSGTVTFSLAGQATLIGSGITYQWMKNSSGAIAGATNQTYTGTVNATDQYFCMVSCNGGAAVSSAPSASVTVNPLPTVTATSSAPVLCAGSPALVLTATGSPATYAWTPAAGLSATTGSPVSASPSSTTTYVVTATDGNGCTASSSVAVPVYQPPTVSTTPSATSACPGDSIQFTTTASSIVNGSLLTTLIAGNGSSGNAFDIIAANTVTVTGFKMQITAGTSAEVWYKAGGYGNANLTSSTGWTQLGTAVAITPAGAGVLTNIPVTASITIPAGQTYGFVVVCDGTNSYTNGTTVGSVFSNNADISITEGHGGGGMAGVFNFTFSPRVWNGEVSYQKGAAITGYAWTPAGNMSNASIADPKGASSVTTTYQVTVTDANGCTATDAETIIANVCSTTLNLTCFIEGYWTGSGMIAALSMQNEPSSPTACDSIDVELHDGTSPYAMVQSVRTVLNQDGTATCIFPSVSGSYYIVVKNRSAVQTWSAAPVAFGAIPTSYNFTTAEAQAYGAGGFPTAQKEVAPGIWAIYSGDVAVDENVDLLDLGLLETDVSDFVFGYNYDIANTNYPGVVATDLNGDGNVDLLDSPILENNISNFIFSNHP